MLGRQPSKIAAGGIADEQVRQAVGSRGDRFALPSALQDMDYH